MRRHDYQAEAALRDRVRAQPTNIALHGELGAWLMRAGRLAQAKEALRTGLAQASRPSDLHHLLGLILGTGGDCDAAERHLQRACELDPGRFEYLRDLAFVQGAAGRTVSSVETLRQAIALGGDAAASLIWLLKIGERAMSEAGVKPERRPPPVARRAAVIERIVARDPEVAEALVSSRRDDLTAEDRETLRAARRALARLASQNPKFADLHFGLSLIAEQLGEIGRAIEAAEKAITLNPRYAEACLLAVRLYERNGQPDHAADRCRQVTRLRPKWIDAHLRLGHLLREQGRPREAIEAYRGALAIDAKCEEAQHRLAGLEAALADEGGPT